MPTVPTNHHVDDSDPWADDDTTLVNADVRNILAMCDEPTLRLDRAELDRQLRAAFPGSAGLSMPDHLRGDLQLDVTLVEEEEVSNA